MGCRMEGGDETGNEKTPAGARAVKARPMPTGGVKSPGPCRIGEASVALSSSGSRVGSAGGGDPGGSAVDQYFFLGLAGPQGAAVPTLLEVLGVAVGVGVDLNVGFAVTDGTFHDVLLLSVLSDVGLIPNNGSNDTASSVLVQ